MDVPTRQSYAMALVSAEERSAAAGIAGVARTTGAAINPLFDPAHAEKQCRGFEFELCSQRRPDRKSNLDCWLRIFADVTWRSSRGLPRTTSHLHRENRPRRCL